MSLNESIVEDDAALEWVGEMGYAVGHGPRAWDGLDRMGVRDEK